jgi:chaperonin cofactor prefoldin
MEETLKLILTEIREIRNDINDMKIVQGAFTSNQEDFSNRLDTLASNQEDFSNRLDTLASNQDTLASNQEEFKKQQFILIAGQKRIENKLDKLNTNVITSMGDYTDKIIHHFDDTAQVLNKRIFKVETELEGKSRQ